MAEKLVEIIARKNQFIQKTMFWALTFDSIKNLWGHLLEKYQKSNFGRICLSLIKCSFETRSLKSRPTVRNQGAQLNL